MFQLRQLPPKWKNHLILLWRYSSFRKISNLMHAILSFWTGNTYLRPPVGLRVEISNRCLIGCSLCYSEKSGAQFPFERYTQLVQELKDDLLEIILHDIGEPLLHERVIDFIQFGHAHRVGTSLSTSLSVVAPDRFWLDLMDSGLDVMVVAIDGITAETYKRYRRNGDLDLVFRNLNECLRHRNTIKGKTKILWQMIDFPWNRHEQQAAKTLAKELGCDGFDLIQEEILPRQGYYQRPATRTRNCIHPFLMLCINAKGMVRPCPAIYRGISDSITSENVVGDLSSQTPEEVWNSDEIRCIRNSKTITLRDYCAFCQE